MKLYEIPPEIQEFERVLVENGGELTPELEQQWSDFIGASKEKLESAAFVICSLEDDIEVCTKEVKRLQSRARAGGRNVDRLRDLTLYALKALGGKLKTPLVSMWVGQTGKQIQIEPKEGTDLAAVAKESPAFVRIKYEPNIEALKEEVRAGREIPACFIVRHSDGSEYLRIK